MVTLRPGHPHSIASVRPSGDQTATVSRDPLVGLRRQRGRRRLHSGWVLYRPVHRDPERGGVTRFLPSWRYRPTPSDPLSHEEYPPANTPVVPQSAITETTYHTATAPTPNGSTPITWPDHPATTALGDTQLLHIVPDAALPETTPRGGYVPTPSRLVTVTELSETHLLPHTDPGPGSSLAALLGFGETPASFGGKTTERNGSEPAANQADDAWNELLSLSAVTADPDRSGNTGDAVKRLWDASADLDLAHGLLTGNVSDTDLPLGRTRRIPWSIVAGFVVLAVLVGTTVKLAVDLPQREAEARAAQYVVAARQLSGALIPIQQSLGVEGLLSDSGLSTLTGQINELDGAARAAGTLASEELPRAPIVGTKLPIDELILPKQLLESASIQAIGVGRRIGEAMAYTLSISTAFDLPPLPAEASRIEVEDIAERLSMAIAETRQSLTGLPDDPFFGVFRRRASDAVTTVEEVQADYIAALLDNDTTTAAALSARINDSIGTLQQGLDQPLGQVQSWALGQIAELRGTVTEIESIVAT